MFLHRRTPAVAVAAFTLSLLASSVLFAATAHGVSLTKVSVPKNIITGSAVTSGRAFYKPTMREDTLAGIRLGREAKEVLSKWGNPTAITVGGGAEQVAPVAPQLGPSYAPPGGASPYGGLAAGLDRAAGMAGMQTSPMGMTGMGLPAMPGYPSPGAAPAPTAAAPTTAANAGLSEDEVTWTYHLNGGISLEFIITDGIVTQITVGGTGPWGLSKTRTGLQLGDTYKLALWVCGYPESQTFVGGKFLRVSYVNKSRVVYTFLNKRIVGVTIALVPTDINN